MFSSDDLSTNNRTHTPTYGLWVGAGCVITEGMCKRAQEIGIQIMHHFDNDLSVVYATICCRAETRNVEKHSDTLPHQNTETHYSPFIYSKTHSYWRWMFLVSTHTALSTSYCRESRNSSSSSNNNIQNTRSASYK